MMETDWAWYQDQDDGLQWAYSPGGKSIWARGTVSYNVVMRTWKPLVLSRYGAWIPFEDKRSMEGAMTEVALVLVEEAMGTL